MPSMIAKTKLAKALKDGAKFVELLDEMEPLLEEYDEDEASELTAIMEEITSVWSRMDDKFYATVG